MKLMTLMHVISCALFQHIEYLRLAPIGSSLSLLDWVSDAIYTPTVTNLDPPGLLYMLQKVVQISFVKKIFDLCQKFTFLSKWYFLLYKFSRLTITLLCYVLNIQSQMTNYASISMD
jgi:hypothetical protein